MSTHEFTRSDIAKLKQFIAQQKEAGNVLTAKFADPQLRGLLHDAVSMGAMAAQPEHFEAGYVSGHRHGWLNGAIAGLLIGALLTSGAIKLGWWLGGGL